MVFVPFVVIGTFAGLVFVFGITMTIVNIVRRRRGLPPLYGGYRAANTRGGLQQEYERLLSERDQRLAAEMEKRRVEEDDPTRGSKVWFSRYVIDGRLKHWVLVIDDTKYELRRDAATGRYVHNVADWTIDLEKREAALAERKIPDVDGYYVCLIGWTQLSSDELKSICGDVMAKFGSYNLLWNNCQDFLQRFADRIISQRALDWPWFREHSKTEYQENQKLPPTPEEIIARQRSAMQQQQATMNQLQTQQVQNNINQMNLQLTMQNVQLNNINMQINLQNTMQNNMMLTNPAMNPAMMGGGGM